MRRPRPRSGARPLVLAAALALLPLLGGNTGANCVPVEPDEPVCAPEDCGPAPGMPNWLCEDQVHFGGPTGRCLPTADGGCGWEILACPEPCAPEACQGQRSLAPNYWCEDGTLAGPVCLRDEADACWWQVRTCP